MLSALICRPSTDENSGTIAAITARDKASVMKLPRECSVLVEGSVDVSTQALPTPMVSSLPNCATVAVPLRSIDNTMMSLPRPASARVTR